MKCMVKKFQEFLLRWLIKPCKILNLFDWSLLKIFKKFRFKSLRILLEIIFKILLLKIKPIKKIVTNYFKIFIYLEGVCLSQTPFGFLSKHAHIISILSPQSTTFICWCCQNKITWINASRFVSNVFDSNNSRIMGSPRINTSRRMFTSFS